MSRLVRMLRRDDRGSTIVEFALVIPVALLVMLGFGDLGYDTYVQAVLTGAVEKAGRDSTIQDNATRAAALDKTVKDIVGNVASQATFTSTRSNYDNYGAVGPEPFTDTNGNGRRDAGECYSDTNGNGKWDADPGVSGQGGASDVVLYTMTVTYPALFPVAGLMGLSASANTHTISASTILRNQPYASQTVTTVQTICT